MSLVQPLISPLIPTTSKTLSGAATFTATATLSAPAVVARVGAVDLVAASTLSASGTVIPGSVANLVAASTLSVSADLVRLGATALSAAASLNVSALNTDVAAGSMTAAAVLSTTGGVISVGTATLTAAGVLTANATVISASVMQATATLTINALVATVTTIVVPNAVTGLPQPPAAFLSASSDSSMTVVATLKVTGSMVAVSTSSLAWHTVFSGPLAMSGASTVTTASVLGISNPTVLSGGSAMTVGTTVIQSHTSTSGGFSVQGFASLSVDAGLATIPPRITIKNLLTVTPTMQTPVVVNGMPTLPTYVGRSTSLMTTTGAYSLAAAPLPTSTANVLPVPATWRWMAGDIPGTQGQSVMSWPEHSGSGPAFTSNTSFAPTVADLVHYDTSTKQDVPMGRVLSIYWRYAQHMGLIMDAPHRMSTPQPYTMQFVMLAHTMTATQYQHIWDAGLLVADGYTTDPASGVVEVISDAVYENKVVNVADGMGNNRSYFGLRPNAVETLFNNTPHIPKISTTTTVDSRPLVYTCIFNAGSASKVRIRGYGVNETLAADTKTSVVNDFVLGRSQNRIGSTVGAHVNLWEVIYYNRALTEDELGQNSHWLGGVYKFSSYH